MFCRCGAAMTGCSFHRRSLPSAACTPPLVPSPPLSAGENHTSLSFHVPQSIDAMSKICAFLYILTSRRRDNGSPLGLGQERSKVTAVLRPSCAVMHWLFLVRYRAAQLRRQSERERQRVSI